MGAAPQVSMAYSSGAVDGVVSTRNTQAPQNGVGWGDFVNNFIERRYVACDTGDRCWQSWNATISLNGTASTMVPMNANRTSWLLKNNPGWRVDRLTGAGNGDQGTAGVDVGEHWRVTTPDGTQYYFGRGINPDTSEATNSTCTVPCPSGRGRALWRGRWLQPGLAVEPGLRHRPDSLSTAYFYGTEINRYLPLGGWTTEDSAPYVRSGWLARIDYGMPRGMAPAAQMIFDTAYRCNTFSLSCGVPQHPANAASFNDVPNDLICANNTAGAQCLAMTPTFFSGRRYYQVRTQVRVGSTWRPVDRIDLGHGHKTNTDGHVDMHLNRLRRVGFSGLSSWNEGIAVQALPWVDFTYTEHANRVDVGGPKTAMVRFRITKVSDEHGAETQVTYSRPHACVPPTRDRGTPTPATASRRSSAQRSAFSTSGWSPES